MSQTSSFSLPIGPVHVALEEPVYFHLDVDGETVRKVEITSGHVHRGMEGMATQRNFFKNTTLTERVCSLCSNSHSLTYCMAVENVLGMTPPPRAQYLRVLAEETKRVASHLFNIAIFAHNVGFKSLFLHIMEVRENMQDVKETIYGNRMNLSANCIGGVKFDMDDSLTVYMLERLDTVEEAVKRVEKVFRTDPLIAKRSRGVGVLSREDAWALGVVGPVARGSGLDIDVRKNTPYLVYPDLYFDIVKEQDGDVWSRAMVRVREVFESIRLLRAAGTDEFELLLAESRKPTAAERGTAMHLFLQFCDYDRVCADGADAELARLQDAGYLNARTAAILDRDAIRRFFASRFFAEVRRASVVRREFRFARFVPLASLTREPTLREALGDRTLYVQGSVDLLCEYPDGRITVADYKTDRISRAERDDPTLLAARLTDEYGSQLEQYAAAVREIYGRAPDRILIYSVPLGEALEIHLPPV